MNLFQELHSMFKEESNLSPAENLEATYEFFYHIVSRLRDMDDFTPSMLLNLQEQVQQGKDFAGSLLQIIDQQYEFADSNYFKDTINYSKDALKSIFNRVITSNHIQDDWRTEINYLADHLTITYLGKEYTLDELQNLVEGGNN